MSTYSIDPNLSIPQHMRELGLGALTHAMWHATTMSFENPYWPELSVLQAAHAAEILIKARIAQKNHLLIFEKIPEHPSKKTPDIKDLYDNGRTHSFQKLPLILKEHTDVDISHIAIYQSFGRLRNAIQHFSPPPNVDFGLEAVRFIFCVIEPLINRSWGLFAIDFNEETDDVGYLVDFLIRNEITFLISPLIVENKDLIKLCWDNVGGSYQIEMQKRLKEAGW